LGRGVREEKNRVFSVERRAALETEAVKGGFKLGISGIPIDRAQMALDMQFIPRK
jgi:hypothetical protein